MHLAAGTSCAASLAATLGLSSCCPSAACFEGLQPYRKEQRAKSSACIPCQHTEMSRTARALSTHTSSLTRCLHSCAVLLKALLQLSLHYVIHSSRLFDAWTIIRTCRTNLGLQSLEETSALSRNIHHLKQFNKRAFESPGSL